MRGVYITREDGHDFYPTDDITEKPELSDVVEYCRENLIIAAEDSILSAISEQEKRALQMQINKWDDSDEYREEQCRLAAQYILDEYDWQFIIDRNLSCH